MEINTVLTIAEARKLMEKCVRVTKFVVDKEMHYRNDDQAIGVLSVELFKYYLYSGEMPTDLDKEIK